MSYQKMKQEHYAETGGLNTKASVYVTGTKEVLDLVNYDFQVPGAWQPRPGTTTGLVGNSLTIGSSQSITALWQITKTGIIAYDLPTSLPQNRILVGHDQGVFKYVNEIPLNAGISIAYYSTLVSGLTACNWNYTNYQSQTYFASVRSNSDFTRFYKYSPNTFPDSSGDGAALFGAIIPQNTMANTFSAGPPNNIPAGTYTYAYATRDQFNFIGPLSLGRTVVSSGSGFQAIAVSGYTSGNGSYSGSSFGFKDFAIFRDHVTTFPSDQLVVIGYAAAGTSFIDTGAYAVNPEPFNTPTYNRFDLLYAKNPTLLEIYANRLWINNDLDLNRIEFSDTEFEYSDAGNDPGALENFQVQNYLRIMNQNYTVMGLKAFNQSLIFFLQKGVVRLTGNNNSNFNQQTITTEYGLVSSKSVVEFENKLWFLDERGIIEFNGSSINTVSNRIEAYFDRMNYVAAQERACAIHYQERNEIWFCIPVDGATVNNIILVYDYLVDAWTTFSGNNIKPTAINEVYLVYGATLAYRNFNNRHMYFGSVGASLYYFDKSLKADDGQGITYSFKTLYHNELGKSRTAQFRRFYLDSGGYAGPTLTYGCQMYSNYSSTAGYTAPLYLSTFQERIDFGIPAAAMSVRVSLGSTQAPIINGYTVEYRYQRDTGTNP